MNRILLAIICIFNGEVWELKRKVWDLFSNFTTEKRRVVFFWSPLKDTLPVVQRLTKMIQKVKYTLTDLQNSTDEKLVDLIFEKSAELELGTFGQSLEIAHPALAEYQAMWMLEADVQNGGFDQFLHNYGLKYAQRAMAGFERIGANDFATLTEKVIEVFKNHSSEFQNKRNPDFNDLDDVFYDLENLEKYQIEYIRKNYEKFLVE